MQMNTKQTPKSCSCEQCTQGKHSGAGIFLRKYDQRAYRHQAKIQLSNLGEGLDDEIFQSGPIGNYYD